MDAVSFIRQTVTLIDILTQQTHYVEVQQFDTNIAYYHLFCDVTQLTLNTCCRYFCLDDQSNLV